MEHDLDAFNLLEHLFLVDEHPYPYHELWENLKPCDQVGHMQSNHQSLDSTHLHGSYHISDILDILEDHHLHLENP